MGEGGEVGGERGEEDGYLGGEVVDGGEEVEGCYCVGAKDCADGAGAEFLSREA